LGGILFILIIQLFFKLYFKERINLKKEKFLAGGGNNFNTKLEFYLNKMIKLNKQMRLAGSRHEPRQGPTAEGEARKAEEVEEDGEEKDGGKGGLYSPPKVALRSVS